MRKNKRDKEERTHPKFFIGVRPIYHNLLAQRKQPTLLIWEKILQIRIYYSERGEVNL